MLRSSVPHLNLHARLRQDKPMAPVQRRFPMLPHGQWLPFGQYARCWQLPPLERLQSLGLLGDWAHIIMGLREGFNVGVNTHFSETHTPQNHASTSLAPDFIDSYILDEQTAGRYSRAFTPRELQSLIGPFRTAPLGLVPNPNSNKFRLIQDLSFPRNDVCVTVSA